MAAFLTSDALSTLSRSVPEWITRLDGLNDTIAQRQKKLSELASDGKLPTPSVKSEGSTESLRPRGETIPPPHQYDDPVGPSVSTGVLFAHHDARPASTQMADLDTPQLSGPLPSPLELLRKPSQSTPKVQGRFRLRKMKMESIITNESAQVPKYRRRSMITVYYDSTSQSTFEDLVKYISANRNSMRKGKMSAKLDAMKRAAEQDAQNNDNEDGDEEEYTIPNITNAGSPFRPTKLGASREPQIPDLPTQPAPIVADKDSEIEADLAPLIFVSTRNMGPPRGIPTASTGRVTAGWIAREYRAGASQFLRDGECSDEIEGIKRRLLDVKAKSDKELETIREEEAKNLQPPRREIKSRELRSPLMRKAALISALEQNEVDKRAGINKSGSLGEPSAGSKISGVEKLTEEDKKKQVEADNRKLEVDKMEVDEDEGIEEDVDMTPILMFRRTRDMVR